MTGEIEFFRKRFVGGFNRQDVVNYISKLAQERNEWREAKEKSDQDVQAFTDEIAMLRLEIEKARREVRESREYKVAALEAALMTFSKLETAFENMRADLDTTIESICTELDQARKTVTSIPNFLARAEEGIKELQAACENEKKDAAFDLNNGGADDAEDKTK